MPESGITRNGPMVYRRGIAVMRTVCLCEPDRSAGRPKPRSADLDPDVGLAWSAVIAAAIELRDFLAERGLSSFPKTTGGNGVHVVVPIARGRA